MFRYSGIKLWFYMVAFDYMVEQCCGNPFFLVALALGEYFDAV
jgi:hypothetical protein